MSTADRDADSIRFAERVLALLDEGQFTATYKYAVLLGLMDLCLERADAEGRPPAVIATRDLAERVIALYWDQGRDLARQDEARVLRQNSGGQARVITLIAAFRARVLGDPSVPLVDARRRAGSAWEGLVRDVEWQLVLMPLPKLQRIGATEVPFIYRIGWGDDVRRRDLASGRVRPEIELVEGAGAHLVRLAGLLRPLIQRQWAAMVARLNRDVVEDAGLEEFLFGVSRTALARVRRPLRELQDNRCFYCGAAMTGPADVDHFIPWARHPDNGIANLVVADQACNAGKRDHLAAAGHVRRWRERAGPDRVGDLRRIAADADWPEDVEPTIAVARAIYLRLPDGAALWEARGRFVDARHEVLAAALTGA